MNDGLPGTPDLPTRLRSEGCARWFGAAFLALWLCGWVAGEVFAACGVVGVTCQLLAPGASWTPGSTSPRGPGAVIVGLFLLLWLTFWTLGGVGAIRELLRLLWAEDEVSVEGGALVVTARLGPWRRGRRFARDEVRLVRLRERDKALVVETARQGEVVLTALGTVEKRAALRDRLHALLDLPDESALCEEDAATVPRGLAVPRRG